MATAGKGLPFIGKLNEFIDRVLHPTVQKVGNSRAAIDVVNRGYYLVDTNPLVVEAGSSDSLLVKTGHAFKVGDSIRLTNTANGVVEQEIIIDEIIDANTVKFAGYLSAPLVAGDEYFHRRPTAELLASDGTRLASLSFIEERTAGNETAVPVRRSYVSDLDTHALPVEVMGADGMVINVTTGDVNVQLRHDDRTVNTINVPGDSVKIGDGTDLLQISADGEALVVVNKELPAGTKNIGKIVITDGVDDAEVKALTTGLADADKGLVTQSVLHGHYSSGGGGWVDIKATQSGALEVNVNGNSNAGDTLAATHDVVMVGAKDENDVAQMLKIDSATKGLLVKSSGDTKIGDAIAADHNLIMAGVKNNAGDADVMKLSATGNLKVSIEETAVTLKNTIAGILKGATPVAEATVSIVDADHNALDIKVQDFAAGLKATSGANTALGTVELSSIANTPFSTKIITYNAQSVSGLSNYYAKVAASIAHGWDYTGQVHREIRLRTDGTQEVYITNAAVTVQPAAASVFNVKSVEGTPVYNQSLAVNGGGVTTIVAPTNARGCKIMAGYGNSSDLKFTLDGSTAPSSTVGFELQPGRSEDFTGVSNLQIIAKNGAATAQEVYIQWRVF